MPRVTVRAGIESATVDYTIPAAAPTFGPTVMPGPSNTGVPAGTVLRRHDGDIVITTADTVLEGLDIYGYVTVKAARAVIRNCIIRGGVQGKQIGIVTCAVAGASLHIHDSEIVAQHPSYQVDGLRGYNITAERLNIHHVIDHVHLYGAGNVKLRDSWLHDNLHYVNDPGWNGGPSHDDGIQIQSGSGYVIEGNRITGAHNAAIQITQDAGPVANVMIRRNYLDGGGCTVNIAQKARPEFVNIDVVGNLFGHASVHNCHIIRPATGDINTAGNGTANGTAVKINTQPA